MADDKKSNPYKDKMSPKEREAFEKFLKGIDEDIKKFSGAKGGKRIATTEFKQAMKKPGAIDKYAGQAWEKDRPKRVREEKRKHMDWLQKQLEKEYKGMSREAKRLTGKPLDPTEGPTVRKIMGKEYREKIKKGGKIKKKYANGGTIRKPSRT
jgi:hypothetical protein